mgnify:CR=1 FL=1
MPSWEIQAKPPLTLKGWSVSARRTALWIPELKMSLDAGGIDPTTGEEPSNTLITLITHGHRDHTKEIHNIALNSPDWDPSKSQTNPFKTKILLPSSIMQDVDTFIKRSAEINAGGRKLSKKELLHINNSYELMPVKYDQVYHLKKYNGSTTLEIKTFKCYHYPTTVGYGISEVRKTSKTDKDICDIILQKLSLEEDENKKETYKEIIKVFSEGNKPHGKYYKFMRDEGINFSTTVTIPLFAFLCDTTTEVAQNKAIFEYPVIIIECTYYDDDPKIMKESKDRCHTHFDLLSPIIKTHPKNHFRLIHHSSRYEKDTCGPETIYEEHENLKKYHNKYLNRSKLTELYSKDEWTIKISQLELEIKTLEIKKEPTKKLFDKMDFMKTILEQYNNDPFENPEYLPNFSIHI